MSVEKKKKYYLGIDLGISSVGWAVMVEHQNSHYLHDFGVRIFDTAEDKKSGETDAQKRRQARHQRRLVRRRANRIRRIRQLLLGTGLIKEGEFYKGLKPTNKIKEEDGQFSTESGFWNHFVLRNKGLKNKLNKSEFYAVLVHFCKKRGYSDKSLFEEENKSKKESGFHSSLAKAEESLKKFGFLSNAVLNDKSFRIGKTKGLLYVKNGLLGRDEGSQVNYRFLFSRQAHQDELKAILKKQSEYYPILEQVLEDKEKTKISDKIFDIVFSQRDFEVGAKCKNHDSNHQEKACSKYKTFSELVGKCFYHPEEKRGYKSSLLFSAYFFVSEISKFFSYLKRNEKIQFTGDEHRRMLDGFLSESWGKAKLKDFIIKTKAWKEKGEDSYFKTEMWKKDDKGMNLSKAFFLKEIRKIPALQKIIEKVMKSVELIEGLKENVIHNLGFVLNQIRTPKTRKEKIKECLEKKNLKLSEKEINAIVAYKGELSTSANVSFKHMSETVKIFLEGKLPMEIFHKEEASHKTVGEEEDIFQKIDDPELIVNPIVFRAINQARKVLKALFHKYKYFSNINIEVGKEVAKNWKDRRKIENEQLRNAKRNEDIRKELSENNLIVNPTNSLALRLWKDQKKRCLYCGKSFMIKDISPASGQVQIDHVIPISELTDNSYQNKVLVCSVCNQKKGKQIPVQFLKENELKKFKARVLNLRDSLGWKKYEYLNINEKDLEEKLMDFVTRDLNDTRYIAKYFTNYVKKQLNNHIKKPVKVLCVAGKITSMFRKKWLFESAWGLEKKVRDITPFHHAIDAIIISQLKGQYEIECAIDLIQMKELKTKIERTVNENLRIYLKEQYKNLVKGIKNKWWIRQKGVISKDKKDENYSSSRYIRRIENFENKGSIKLFCIPNLPKEIEKRIPVVLERADCNECREWSRQKIERCNNCLGEKKVPKFVDLLSEKEWKEKNKNTKANLINLKYPLVSYMVNYKLRGSWSSSENFGFKEKEKTKYYKIWKNDPDLSKEINRKKISDSKKWKKWKEEFKNKEGFIENEHGNIIPTDEYYGVVFSSDKKSEKWLRKIDLKEKIRESKKKKVIWDIDKSKLLVKGVNVSYSDTKKDKVLVRNFRGKAGKAVIMHPNQLEFIGKLDKNKKIFGETWINYYDTLTSIKKSKVQDILKLDVLGNIIN